jgi:Flp pilus assembly pilin Flp
MARTVQARSLQDGATLNMPRWFETGATFLAARAGAATIEMALLAPVLILALLAAYDLGGAVQQRMHLAYVVRVGVESASANSSSVPEVTARMQIAADMAIAAGSDQIQLTVERLCACPAAEPTFVSCSLPCSGGIPNFIYFRMSADRVHQGILIPSLPLQATGLLQVR